MFRRPRRTLIIDTGNEPVADLSVPLKPVAPVPTPEVKFDHSLSPSKGWPPLEALDLKGPTHLSQEFINEVIAKALDDCNIKKPTPGVKPDIAKAALDIFQIKKMMFTMLDRIGLPNPPPVTFLNVKELEDIEKWRALEQSVPPIGQPFGKAPSP